MKTNLKGFVKALCFVSLLFASNAYAQFYTFDKANIDGSRTIMTDYKQIYNQHPREASVLLGCYINGKDTTYHLIFSLKFGGIQINEGRSLLIKLNDGSVIELKNTDATGFDFNRKTMYWDFITYPTYAVTKEQINKIYSGVDKLRFETELSNIDIDVTPNFSLYIKSSFNEITEILNKKKKDVHLDF